MFTIIIESFDNEHVFVQASCAFSLYLILEIQPNRITNVSLIASNTGIFNNQLVCRVVTWIEKRNG